MNIRSKKERESSKLYDVPHKDTAFSVAFRLFWMRRWVLFLYIPLFTEDQDIVLHLLQSEALISIELQIANSLHLQIIK